VQARDCVEDGVLEVTGKYTGPYRSTTQGEEHKWPYFTLSGTERGVYLDLKNNRWAE
jgi:hypothetical protein